MEAFFNNLGGYIDDIIAYIEAIFDSIKEIFGYFEIEEEVGLFDQEDLF